MMIEFLRGHKGGKPFYAYVPFTAPHDPRQPPVPHRERYYKKRPPLPKNFENDDRRADRTGSWSERVSARRPACAATTAPWTWMPSATCTASR